MTPADPNSIFELMACVAFLFLLIGFFSGIIFLMLSEARGWIYISSTAKRESEREA